jgi:hypothetical protein
VCSEDERMRGAIQNGPNVGGDRVNGGCNQRLTSALRLNVNMMRVHSSSKSKYTA